jgi:tetratricopeptide (TPR) repeat protein
MASLIPPADTADPLSNVVTSPDASRVFRCILQAALDNQASKGKDWVPQAQALLANVLMNDHLNWWNQHEKIDRGGEAQKLVDSALGTHPKPPDPVLALAHLAQGLIHRADKKHREALKSFKKARELDPGFARAQAQFGNQKILLGYEQEANAPLNKARTLNSNHPATGYFNWGIGRAYFQQKDWWNAIYWLKMSVDALPTVWYNRCYLAAAQDAAGDPTNKAAAQKTKQDFIKVFGQPVLTQAINSLKPNSSDPKSVAEARKRVHDFLL